MLKCNQMCNNYVIIEDKCNVYSKTVHLCTKTAYLAMCKISHKYVILNTHSAHLTHHIYAKIINFVF